MTDHQTGHEPAESALTLQAAARLSSWCARHPRTIIGIWALALTLAAISLSQLTVSASLPAMLGQSARAAAATQRITTGFQGGEDLLIIVQPPEYPAANATADSTRTELVSFAESFTASINADPESRGIIATVRTASPEDFAIYVRQKIIPNAAFFLTDAQFYAAIAKLSPNEIRAQIGRNEALLAGAGPAAGVLSKQILRDPLRLFELATTGADSAFSAPGLQGTSPLGAPPSGENTAIAAPPEFSADGQSLLIRIGSIQPPSNLEVARRLTELAETHVRIANTTGLRVRLGGPAPIAATASTVIRQDAIWATVASVSLLAVLFGFFYRRWTAALLIGGTTFTGMIIGVGALGLFLGEISPLGAMIAALLAGLGTDYGIHFLSHYDGARSEGLTSVQSSTRTARDMAVPIATNCLTSVFGFASLWLSDIKMLSDFASLGAAGLAGALIAVFILLPAVLALTDGASSRGPSGTDRFGQVACHIARWPRSCIAICVLSLLAAVLAAANRGFVLQLEPDLTVMHPRPNTALDATRFVMENFTGRGELVPVEVRCGPSGDIAAAAADAATAIRNAAPPVPGLVSITGLHQLVPDSRSVPARAARLAAFDAAGTLEAFDRALDDSTFDPKVYGGYRRFLESLFAARHPPTITDVLASPAIAHRLFPRAETEPTPQAINTSPTSLTSPTSTVLLVTLSKPLTDRQQRSAAISALTAALQSQPNTTVAGLAAVSEELQAAVQIGLPRSVALSVLLVLIWLMLVFRRPIDVILALIPLAFAGGATVLFMIATRQNFNPINSVAIPLLDGIAVDAGVFLVAAARAHGSSRENLIRHLPLTTHAIILAAATTLTAFLAFYPSHTPAVRSLGLIASVGITAAFAGVLLLLMPILILRARPAATTATTATTSAPPAPLP